jgi:hypothetical protein
MNSLSPFGERSLTVVAASFEDREGAERAATVLVRDTPELRGEVAVIPPGDPLLDRKLEPENRGIWRTLVRSHVLFAGVGLAVGVAVAWLAIAIWPAAALSPAYTLLFATVVGAFAGMISAGQLTVRPDHGYVIDKVHEFVRAGRWAVVARPLNEACSKAAYAKLLSLDGGAVRSL